MFFSQSKDPWKTINSPTPLFLVQGCHLPKMLSSFMVRYIIFKFAQPKSSHKEMFSAGRYQLISKVLRRNHASTVVCELLVRSLYSYAWKPLHIEQLIRRWAYRNNIGGIFPESFNNIKQYFEDLSNWGYGIRPKHCWNIIVKFSKYNVFHTWVISILRH